MAYTPDTLTIDCLVVVRRMYRDSSKAEAVGVYNDYMDAVKAIPAVARSGGWTLIFQENRGKTKLVGHQTKGTDVSNNDYLMLNVTTDVQLIPDPPETEY